MPNVIVMATPMTIRNEKFHNLMDRYVEMAHIIPLPCPGLMEFVERGETSGEALYDFISNLLAPFDRDRVDAVVLGCTHYPFVAETVRKVMGEKAVLYEGGPGTARETRRRLEAAGLLTDRTTVGKITIENSLSEEKVKICERLLEM